MYAAVATSEPLFQGDVFDDCPIFYLEGEKPPFDLDKEPRRWKSRVIVLTQS